MVTSLFVVFYQEFGKILLLYKYVCTQMFDLENVRNYNAKVHKGKKQYFQKLFWDDISREVM